MANKKIVHISCPLCGMRRPLTKRGTNAALSGKPMDKGFKGRTHFNNMDLRVARIFQICECFGTPKNAPEGKRGFPTVAGATLEEMCKVTELEQLVDEIYGQCKTIVEVIDRGRGHQASHAQ